MTSYSDLQDSLPSPSPWSSGLDLGVSCVDPDGRDYLMGHNRRGYCLIFYMTSFDGMQNIKVERSRKDCVIKKSAAVRRTFKALGFDCRLFENLRKDEVIEQLQTYSGKETELENSDCFVCWLLTAFAGKERYTLRAYDVSIELSDMTRPFFGDKCKKLAGKPKLFFIDADPAEILDEGTHFSVQCPTQPAEVKIPVAADFLIGMSPRLTVAEAKAIVNSEYAETVCNIFDEYISDFPLNDITFLLDLVAMEVDEKIDNGKTSSCTSTLRKMLYFTKREPMNMVLQQESGPSTHD